MEKRYVNATWELRKEGESDFPSEVRGVAAVVDQTTGGIDFLMKKNEIDVFQGLGSFVDPHRIKIEKEGDESEEIESKNVIIATGSKPASLPFVKLDKERLLQTIYEWLKRYAS